MAAVGIVGLAIGSAASLRTVLLSVRQRYERFSNNNKEFDDVVDDLARITENLREIEQRMSSRPREDNNSHVERQLKNVNKRLLASRKILDKLSNGPLRVHPGPSCAALTGVCSRITSVNRINDKLSKISANLSHVDNLLNTAATLLGISEFSRALRNTDGVDRHLRVSSVPILTHQEVLDFDGKDENGNPTPEAQLKMHVLDKQSKKVVAAAGNTSSRAHGKVQGAHGMAGVGKTVALKGLGWDDQVREAFEEIHYITLGHDATAETVVSELARIVEMSGGERQSCMVLGCKDVSAAVLHTSKWFCGRKCLFLVDDVWKTGHNNFGYLPVLRHLLSTSERSRMAITTRDRNIAGEAGQAVEFGSRGATISRNIFLGYFGSDTLDATSEESIIVEGIERILNICKGVPLVLGIAGRGARALKEEGRSAGHALTEYANILERRKLSVLEESPPGYGREDESLTLRTAIEMSLAFLDRRCKTAGIPCDMGIAKMYRALSVLKAQAWAPLSMLSKLWNVNQEDAKRIMGQLCTMSLARWEYQTYNATSSNVEKRQSGLKIHDLQLEYCRQHCEEMRRLHGNLLDRYLEAAVAETRAQVSNAGIGHNGAEDALLSTEPRPWWSVNVLEDSYVNENVAWHLVRAGKRDELRGLLLDARWIKLRLVIGGILALENDFAELVHVDDVGAVGAEKSAAEWSDSEFRAILNALRCSWQYLVQNKQEIAVQLSGRLFDVQEGSAAARKLVKSAIRNSERPFAEARYGFLPDSRSGQVNEVSLGGLCNSLSYSSCGKYIAAAVGKDVVVMESYTFTEKLRLEGHTYRLSSVCFLPQSLKIVSGSHDGTVRVWDVSKPGDNAVTLESHGSPVINVCASADGSRVASGSEDKAVRLWNLQEEASAGEAAKRRSKWMSRLFYGGDGANGTEDVGIAVYECEVLRGHTDMVRCVCFSPDGALLASGSDDGTVQLWNGRTGRHTGVTIEGHEGKVYCVAFSPDGERIACGSSNGTIRLWRADTGAPAGIVMDDHSGLVLSVAFSADGARIVSASDDMTVRIWSAETGAAVGAALKGHTDQVTSAVFSPDGARVASVSGDRTLRIWEPERAGEVSVAREGHSSLATCAAFSADGFRIAVGYEDWTICIWDTQSGRAIGGPLKGHTDVVQCVAFSPDGAMLASGSDDKTVRLWNAHTGAAVTVALKGHEQGLYKVSFSADGSKLLSFSSWDKSRCLWSVPSGVLLWMSHRSSEDVANILSDAEVQAAMESMQSQSRPDSSNETGVVYYDRGDGAVKMKCNEGDVRLASLPPLALPESARLWKHIADRNEFAAVLNNGRPVCLILHV